MGEQQSCSGYEDQQIVYIQNLQPQQQQQINNQLPYGFKKQVEQALGQSSLSQPVSQTITIKNLVNLRKDTMKLYLNPQNRLLYLTFRFDSEVPCTINVYIMATEAINQQTNFTNYFYVDLSRHQQPMAYQFQKGQDQEFINNLFPLDLNRVTEKELSECDPHKLFYPIVVEMKSNVPYQADQAHTQITQAVLKKQNQDYKIKVMLQKILVGTEKVFVLEEIYGGNQKIQDLAQKEGFFESDLNSEEECVICCTEKKNTAVLPCRHLCICQECAEIVRNQPAAKCPICRKDIESFLFIKVKPQNQKQ